jgi:hypothetical protein
MLTNLLAQHHPSSIMATNPTVNHGVAERPFIKNWRLSNAKQILLADLNEGGRLGIKEASTKEAWENIYSKHVDFSLVPYRQFHDRLRDLQKALTPRHDASSTMATNPTVNPGVQELPFINWRSSNAKKTLVTDLHGDPS